MKSDIVQRLLDEKHITAQEAVELLETQPVYIPMGQNNGFLTPVGKGYYGEPIWQVFPGDLPRFDTAYATTT